MAMVIRTLIVEDNPVHLELIQKTLEKTKFNYQIKVADKGMDAIELVESFTFDLALIDIKLPDISGFEVVKRAKLVDVGVPTIVVSTSSNSEDVKRAYGLNVMAYIVKPTQYRGLVPFFDGILQAITNENFTRPES